MLSKALAREANATFVSISVSTVTNKWYGESKRLLHAVFSRVLRRSRHHLRRRINCFLRGRGGHGGGEHEVTGMMKAE